MASKSLTPSEIKQLEYILSQTASLAKSVRRLAIHIDDEEPELAEMVPVMIQKLAEQIGWCADLAMEKIGSSFTHHGTAEDWMMPPAYHDAVRTQHC